MPTVSPNASLTMNGMPITPSSSAARSSSAMSADRTRPPITHDAITARSSARGALRLGSTVSSPERAGGVEPGDDVRRRDRGDQQGADVTPPRGPSPCGRVESTATSGPRWRRTEDDESSGGGDQLHERPAVDARERRPRRLLTTAATTIRAVPRDHRVAGDVVFARPVADELERRRDLREHDLPPERDRRDATHEATTISQPVNQLSVGPPTRFAHWYTDPARDRRRRARPG